MSVMEETNPAFLNVKIKTEKITPPSTPQHPSIKSENGDTLFEKLLNDAPIETKPTIEPIKSSNQILAELFQVFNAPPPKVNDINTEEALQRKKLKKAKKKLKKEKKEKKAKVKKEKKKHKKHKKSERTTDGDDDSSSDSSRSDHATGTLSAKLIKKEPIDKYSESEVDHKHSVSLRRGTEKIEITFSTDTVKKEGGHGHRKTSADTRSTKEKTSSSSSHKIIIKNLSNSAVYKETIKQVEDKERARNRSDKHSRRRDEASIKDDDDDAFSISDEETYLKDRLPRDSSRNDFYDSKDRYSRTSDKDKGGRHSSSSSRLHDDRTRDRDYERRSSRDYERSRNDRDYDRNSTRSYDRRGRSREDHRNSSNYRRTRSRSRQDKRFRRPEDDHDTRIDKKRLLEIARKNAISMLANGTLPGTQNLPQADKEKILAKMRFGGKTVDELTEFCKKLSKGESAGYLSNVSDDSDDDVDGEGVDKPFHHPFVLKDRGPIVMNIKNSIPIAPKTSEQTKVILMQFPVSSGQQHRQTENEWVPVEPPKPVPAPVPPKKDAEPVSLLSRYQQLPKSTPAVPEATVETSAPEPVTNIFPTAEGGKNLDVSSIITKRLNAMRKLQDNPLDSEALKLMYNTQKDMSAWANSKFVPGQFTGSTGANVLSAKELQSGFQAWAKRDQLISTTPFSGGMGMHLLQKMGWRPGEGLGKEKNGSLQPLLLEVKLDKKGLVANEETPQGKFNATKGKKMSSISSAKQNLESKHPVSLLGEICAKRKYGAPMYEVVSEAGPFHSRQFLFKVIVNDMVFQPQNPSLNKKEAKAVAARVALQNMGVISNVPGEGGS